MIDPLDLPWVPDSLATKLVVGVRVRVLPSEWVCPACKVSTESEVGLIGVIWWIGNFEAECTDCGAAIPPGAFNYKVELQTKRGRRTIRCFAALELEPM